MVFDLLVLWAFLRSWIHRYSKLWTKPATVSIAAGSLFDLTRSRTVLLAENAMLRQQLIVLKRQGKRPMLTNGDRIRLLLLARCTRNWRQALHIIQPDTLLRWHRELFRRYWRCKSKSKQRKPRITPETIDLIKQMAKENRLWGAERIRGELHLQQAQALRTCNKRRHFAPATGAGTPGRLAAAGDGRSGRGGLAPRPVLDSLGEVRRLDAGRSCQVGDGERQLMEAVEGASGHA